MKQDIRLYLAGQRADLKDDPKLLFNYKITDTENPTAVKNSFSKTIVLEGTDNNNAIFGEIYDLSRLQQYAVGNYSGIYFNPLKKTEFSLYVDTELYETGYFKLTEVTKTKNDITYSITCYGGLGEFLQNLSESEAGNKLEFKDIKIVLDKTDPYAVEDLGFTVSKETIAEAWEQIDHYSGKWSIINFAPCYNGLPDNFDANHCIINLSGKTTPMGSAGVISSYQGWAKGETSRDLSEWEARDLRSYMQRPVLNVMPLIQSICLPENNGGFEVDLDSHFFNYDNPYYSNAWLSLNLVKDMMGEGEDSQESQTITGATITQDFGYNNTGYTINTDVPFSSFSNLGMEIGIQLDLDTIPLSPSLYLTTDIKVKNSSSPFSYEYVRKYYRHYSTILLQLVAFDELGEVVATSAAYELTSYEEVSLRYAMDSNKINIPEWKRLVGKFTLSGGTYVWTDLAGTRQTIKFSFPSNTNFYSLKLRVQTPYVETYKTTGLFGGSTTFSGTNGNRYYWPNRAETVSGSHRREYYLAKGTLAGAEYTIENFKAVATEYGGFLSGKYVSQDRLLTLGITPADFLLSYIKLFGLHIWRDATEKRIHIADRNTFYERGVVVDVHDLIDRSKTMKITPQVAKTKWYDFNTEQHDSEANEQYKEEYGMDFGLQRVNTNYDFDTNNEAVYGGKFRGGIQVLESSPYYYMDYNLWPVWVYNGFKVTTYSLSGTSLVGNEKTVDTQTDTQIYPFNPNYNGFDLFDKPQFHTEDNGASDGDLTLLFYNGQHTCTSTTAGGILYFVTDDLEEMVRINDKRPCWILTEHETGWGGESVGIRMYSLPQFSRYRIFPNNGYITHSWDFGRTLETYIPDTYLTEGCSIYERFWKNYISDMYDVNSRVLSCYMLIRGQVSPEWLRRFYFFDGSYWRLNAVKEWNPGSYQTTLCEFLKVNDLESYHLDRVTNDPILDFYLPDYIGTKQEYSDYLSKRYYTIGPNVSAVTGYIKVQDGGRWYYGDGPGGAYVVDYDNGTFETGAYSALTQSGNDQGEGDTAEVFNIGANTSGSGRTFNLNIVIYGSSGDYWRSVVIRQEAQEIGSIIATRFGGSGNVDSDGQDITIMVTSNSPWTAETTYDYTTLDRTTGVSGTSTVTMTVAANDSASWRNCQIEFGNSAGGSYVFNIAQDGQGQISTFSFNADSYTFPSTGGTVNAVIECPDYGETGVTWGFSEIPAWITAEPSTGAAGVTQVVLTAAANDGDARFSDVRAASPYESDYIHFGQAGA